MRNVQPTRSRGFVIPTGSTMPTRQPSPLPSVGRDFATLTRHDPAPWRTDGRQVVPSHVIGKEGQR